MKELSIEEKAKCYDEAIERANNILEGKCKNIFIYDNYNRTMIDYLLSELKESEDERIRKGLLYVIEHHPTLPTEEAEEYIAWLKKQSDSNKEYWRGYREGKKEILDKYSEHEKQDEQKPAWSEEDKEMSRFIGNAITADGASEYLESKGIQVIDAHVWLDGLKDKVQPQPKQEWSDDFEEEMDRYIEENFYGSAGYGFFSNRTKRELEAEDVVRIGCHFATWQKEQLKKSFNKQKQEWAEEDESILFHTINNLKFLRDTISINPEYVINIIDIEREINWIKSLKDRVGCKANRITTNEWSEEDEDIRDNIIRDLKRLSGDMVSPNQTYQKEIQWLKSLRPQHHWKPSDEQMHAFKQVYDWYNNNFAASETLTSLYNDLKKLKE